MNRNILLSAVFLLISLASCQPRKAIAFKDTIQRQERAAFQLLVGENGPGTKMLEHLTQHQFDSALAMVAAQEKAFNHILDTLAALPVDGLQHANELKAAATEYYKAVKELQLFDREDIRNQRLMREAKGDTLQAALDRSLTLSREKQELYKKVHDKEAAFSEARQQFDTANGL